ncbi:MAG: GNAT family N-acetyltransferase [Chloroflexi bacterium]|nr:GNAT family N-acetyltransferase [Chloroflexota bacterium]
MSNTVAALRVEAVTAKRWEDMRELYGPSGAYSGCWCMWWRVKSKEFESNGNRGNKAAMQAIVKRDKISGLLGYLGEQAVGWISLGPREVFGRRQRSPLFKPVDEQPVWSIVCFFIHRKHRNTGVATQLLAGACDYARAQGAEIVEAYPVDTRGKEKGQASLFTGTEAMFRKAGVKEVARRKATRTILRKEIG